jgi:hypothetical protein
MYSDTVIQTRNTTPVMESAMLVKNELPLEYDHCINTVLISVESVLIQANRVWNTGKLVSLRFSINLVSTPSNQ